VRRLLVAPCVIAASLASAQQSPPRERAPGYAPLDQFVGHWTSKGLEATFLEKCEWFDGRHHVVCRAETRRKDGTIGHSMSILGYLPGENVYTYHGIGSRGRNDTRRGNYRDGVFSFSTESREGGKVTVSRVRVGPFMGREVPFVEEAAVNGGEWKVRSSDTLLKVE
jgi:hypothetical protein